MSEKSPVPEKIKNKIIKKKVTLNNSNKGEAKKAPDMDTFQANTSDANRKKKKGN